MLFVHKPILLLIIDRFLLLLPILSSILRLSFALCTQCNFVGYRSPVGLITWPFFVKDTMFFVMHRNLSTSENIGGVKIIARITRKGLRIEPVPKIF
jgi:hypothetical protein